MKLILASASPRRRELLQQLGLEFEVIAAERAEEKHEGAPVPELVQENAQRKVEEVARNLSGGGVILGADTVLEFEARAIGKPADKHEAARILERLSNKSHLVHTGIALLDRDSHQSLTAVSSTEVTFKPLTSSVIESYLGAGEYRDKAGAYAIQGLGAALIRGIKGEYSNVVGLPLGLLSDLLPRFGIFPLVSGNYLDFSTRVKRHDRYRFTS
ncbi:MAG: Maf family protein [bacterium]